MITTRCLPLLLLCSLLLLVGCISPAPPPDGPPSNPTAEVALAFLEGFSGGLLETVGTETLRKQQGGPQLIALFDKPGPNGEPPDGKLTIGELRAMVTAASPQELAGRISFLTAMGWALYEEARQHRAAAPPPPK